MMQRTNARSTSPAMPLTAIITITLLGLVVGWLAAHLQRSAGR
jgi:hypothetical protein